MPTVATRSTARTTLAAAADAIACIVVVALCDDGLARVDLFTGATAQADAVEYARCRAEDGDGELQFAVKRLHGARAARMLAAGDNAARIAAYRTV